MNFQILRNSAVEEATSRIVVVLATKTGLSPKPSTRVGNKGWVQLCVLLRKLIFYWVTNERFCTLPMRNPTTDWLYFPKYFITKSNCSPFDWFNFLWPLSSGTRSHGINSTTQDITKCTFVLKTHGLCCTEMHSHRISIHF